MKELTERMAQLVTEFEAMVKELEREHGPGPIADFHSKTEARLEAMAAVELALYQGANQGLFKLIQDDFSPHVFDAAHEVLLALTDAEDLARATLDEFRRARAMNADNQNRPAASPPPSSPTATDD